MNMLNIIKLHSNLIKDEILARALSFWLAFLNSPSACSSKISLLSIFIPKSYFIHKYPPDEFFITKKKVKFIWVHLHTVTRKPESKTFLHTLNFINYFQFWTTHCKWSVLHNLLRRYLVQTERDHKERH